MIYLRAVRLSSRIAVVAMVLIFPLIAGPTAAGAAAAAAYVKVTGLSSGRVVWVRFGPSSSFKRIGFLPYSARHIRNYGCKQLTTEYWCKVRYRGTRGWALGRYLVQDKALEV